MVLDQVISLNIDSMFDGACGDFRWMYVLQKDLYNKYKRKIKYWGNDIVYNVVKHHQKRYHKSYLNLTFSNFDLTNCSKWPSNNQVSLIFIRKALQHNAIQDVMKILKCADKSSAKWLLVNSYDTTIKNKQILAGEMAYHHLSIEPFNLPPPFAIYDETNTGNNIIDHPFVHLYRF